MSMRGASEPLSVVTSIMYGDTRPVLCQDRTTKRIDFTKKGVTHSRPRKAKVTESNA